MSVYIAIYLYADKSIEMLMWRQRYRHECIRYRHECIGIDMSVYNEIYLYADKSIEMLMCRQRYRHEWYVCMYVCMYVCIDMSVYSEFDIDICMQIKV